MTKRTDVALATVRDLAQQGATDATIAETLAVSVRTVECWRKHAGIPAGWAGPVRTAPHGTPTRYESGCSCAPCRAAHAARARAYTARLRAAVPPTPKSGTPWTADDDQVLLDVTRGTVAQRARILGRTYAGSVLRLDAINRRERRKNDLPSPVADANASTVPELGAASASASESIVSHAH